MEDNTLLIFTMYYSLFNKTIFDENIINKYFPKNVFGIFSTIRRNNKLETYPIDIHGCIGYWDINFNNLSKDKLYNKLLKVSYDSLWNDSRKKYFDPIETDPYSFQELDFMLNPIYKINKKNGIIIDLNKDEVKLEGNVEGQIVTEKETPEPRKPELPTDVDIPSDKKEDEGAGE